MNMTTGSAFKRPDFIFIIQEYDIHSGFGEIMPEYEKRSKKNARYRKKMLSWKIFKTIAKFSSQTFYKIIK